MDRNQQGVRGLGNVGVFLVVPSMKYPFSSAISILFSSAISPLFSVSLGCRWCCRCSCALSLPGPQGTLAHSRGREVKELVFPHSNHNLQLPWWPQVGGIVHTTLYLDAYPHDRRVCRLSDPAAAGGGWVEQSREPRACIHLLLSFLW